MHAKQVERMVVFLSLLPLSFLTTLVFLAPVKAELVVTEDLSLDIKPGRILPDAENDCYWITGWLSGLLCVTEEQPGLWGTEMYPQYKVIDAAGPTSAGYIYCTYQADPPNPLEAGIAIFDCASRQYIDTIDLPWEYGLHAITISPDEERLYGTVLTTEIQNDSPEEASENSGLAVEIDIASGSVLRTCSVRAWPETIFLWNDCMLLVSCAKGYWIEYEDDQAEVKSTTDIVSLDTFTKVAQIPSGGFVWAGTNDFVQWDESTVGLLNAMLNSDFDDPKFLDSVWLIDPETGSVTKTFPTPDSYGREHGVKHAFRSELCPDLFYLALMQDMNFDFTDPRLIVTDFNGMYVDSAIGTPDHFDPEYIYELDDGRVMVTDGLFRKIYIFEWVNHPPICALELLTTMPYVGLSPALIEFNATPSYDPDPCDELAYEWDFDGDGLYGEAVDDSYTGPSVAPTHAYTENYRGYVYLKVSDGRGGESICEVEVSVTIQ